MTFSKALSTGTRLKLWNTKPILALRKLAAALASRLETSISPITTFPLSGLSNRPMTFSNVDLPLPDGPQTHENSPLCTSRDTPCMARTAACPSPYDLLTFVRETRYLDESDMDPLSMANSASIHR